MKELQTSKTSICPVKCIVVAKFYELGKGLQLCMRKAHVYIHRSTVTKIQGLCYDFCNIISINKN